MLDLRRGGTLTLGLAFASTLPVTEGLDSALHGGDEYCEWVPRASMRDPRCSLNAAYDKLSFTKFPWVPKPCFPKTEPNPNPNPNPSWFLSHVARKPNCRCSFQAVSVSTGFSTQEGGQKRHNRAGEFKVPATTGDQALKPDHYDMITQPFHSNGQ